VPTPDKWLQPRSYHAFSCIGAECEDTCCTGWIVNLDKPTYEAYQRCEDPELGPRIRQLVTINAAGAGDRNHARFTLSGHSCPFLSEGLCAIQKKLGEPYLPVMCATYPRVMNVVDGVLQRSLDLSCPEAARVVLLDPNLMEFDGEEGRRHDPRLGRLAVLSTAAGDSAKPYQAFREIRGLAIWLLQYRAWPLWKRLVILASLCDRLQDMAAAGQHRKVRGVVEWYRDAAQGDFFDQTTGNRDAQPAAQLEMVLELIVGRLGSDYTAPRFLALYQEFMRGLDWTPQSSMDDLGRRYASIFAQHYAPFLSRHEYMLEHYLVSYVHRTLFPLGPQEDHREPSVHYHAGSIRDQCLLMLVYYALTQTMLVGLSGFHQAEFAPGHVVQAIQCCTKAFEHHLSFPGSALRLLADKGVKTCTSLALLGA
jgi:lysine-N-methylase